MYSFIYILLFLCASLSLTGCKKQQPPFEHKPISVTALTVEPQTIPSIFEYIAVAQSSHQVEIRARIEGYLQKMAYQEGQLVKADELLFVIDPKQYEAALQQAKGSLAEQEANLWEAQRSVERLKPLYEQNAASRRDLDNALAAEERTKASVEIAKGQLIQAELNLSYTTVLSPVTGLASKSNYREGALISPGPTGLLTTISVIDPIWVNFNVSEGDILKYSKEVKKGTIKPPDNGDFKVEVLLADGSTFESIGKIDFAEPTLDQSTGTMSVRAIFDNSEEILRPGQFVRVRLSGAVRPNAIVVPQKSVMQGKKGLFVYVIDKNNNATARSVDAGEWYKDYWIINSGLSVGDKVIVDGTNKVIPDMSVDAEMITYPKDLLP